MKTYDEINLPPDLELSEEEKEEYLRFIKDSYVPKDDERRMAQNIDGLIEYDFINTSAKNNLEGHNKRRFVMLDSKYFEEYLTLIKNDSQSSSYVSYLDNEDIKKGIYPKHLSTMLKKVAYEKFAYNEVVAPKILNFFGVETVVNKCLMEGDDIYLLSLDFIKPYQRFFDSSDFDCPYFINASGDIRDALDAIDFKVDVLKKRLTWEYASYNAKIDKEKLKENYIKTYLVRVLLLGDGDFNNRNYGFIYDFQKNEIMVNPNFDFEYAFAMETNEFGFYKSNLNFIRNNYASIYNEFIKNLTKFISFNKKTDRYFYEDIINSEIFDKTTTKMYCNDLGENIDILLNDYFEYIAKKQKQ